MSLCLNEILKLGTLGNTFLRFLKSFIILTNNQCLHFIYKEITPPLNFTNVKKAFLKSHIVDLYNFIYNMRFCFIKSW